MLLLLQKIYVGGKDYKEDQNLGGNFLMKKQRECEKFYNIEQRKLKRSNITLIINVYQSPVTPSLNLN
jgi:hypothetical protein